jgi:uncharacterized membrane protein
MQRFFVLLFLAAFFSGIFNTACKHDPVIGAGPDPIDTTENPGGGGGGGGTGVPCSPDSIYFQNQVLPILVSNCTEAGCHNAQDREDEVVLDSYAALMATVENASLNNWNENELMEVLLEDDPDKRMPYGKAPLPTAQINLIAQWIQQGAKNNGCNENAGQCNTSDVRFGNFVQPLIQARCQGCHSGSAPQGGVALRNHAEIKAQAQNGKLYAAITRSTNWMPKGGAKLDDCTTSKIKAWVDAGAPNN